MNKKKMMMFEIMSGNSGGGGADVSGVTATAPDVDEGKIFVDNTGSQVVGTSTYKADYIALRTDIDNLNDTLEPVLLGDGSDTNVYANVSNVTATASDVATGKVFVDNTGEEVTGTASGGSEEAFISMIERPDYASVTVPNSVTKIGNSAFRSWTKAYTISMPNTITYIDDYAFTGCEFLGLSSLPSSLTYIGTSAFANCKRITINTIPIGVTYVAATAFSGCTALTSITFLSKPQAIASDAFQRCTSLTSINVPWSFGEVSGAPWGATNATVVYDYTPS